MPAFDPNAFYKVTLSRASVILKTEYPANVPFKANGDMTQAFADAGALADAEALDGPQVVVHASIQRTDNRLMEVREFSTGVVRPDNRNLEEAVNDLPEPDRIHYYEKMAALKDMGQV